MPARYVDNKHDFDDMNERSSRQDNRCNDVENANHRKQFPNPVPCVRQSPTYNRDTKDSKVYRYKSVSPENEKDDAYSRNSSSRPSNHKTSSGRQSKSPTGYSMKDRTLRSPSFSHRRRDKSVTPSYIERKKNFKVRSRSPSFISKDRARTESRTRSQSLRKRKKGEQKKYIYTGYICLANIS